MTHDSRHTIEARSTAPTPTRENAGGRAEIEAYYRTIAPFYDAEQAGRHDLGFWQQVAERHPGGRVLEIGAGSGQVTAVLAPKADALVGLDLSSELLRLARTRLARWPHVRLVQADMLALPFRESFDLIVAANDPLSHLIEGSDRDRALDAVARHLAPGGRFVLDALWLAPSEAAKVARRGGRVEQRTTTLDGNRLRVLERWERTDDDRQCCHAHYEYHCGGRGPVVADFDAHDWSADELFTRLGRAGLAVTNVWGSYQGERWDPAGSSQLIVEAALA
jgi:SAM-dependent methyltransferase